MIDIKSENFWVDANKLCAAYNGEDWNKLSADEKTYQVDNVLDANLPDLSEFGDYASNFFDEDLVGEPDCYPAEEMQGFGESFHFNNMVFVVSFDPNKMIPSPVSGKIGYDAIPQILEKRDRSFAGPTAPACGLYLNQVHY